MNKFPPSLGAEQLAASGTISAVAKKLGVADRTVASWRAGKLPNRASVESIERVLGIPAVAWTRMPAAPSPAAAPSISPTSAPTVAAPTSARQSAEARLREQLGRLRAQRETPGLTERSRVELEKLELQASARLARLEGASGLSLRQVMNSPHVKTIADSVLGTLRDSPLELCAVIDDLERLEDRASFHLEDVRRDHPVESQSVLDANAELVRVMLVRAKSRAA